MSSNPLFRPSTLPCRNTVAGGSVPLPTDPPIISPPRAKLTQQKIAVDTVYTPLSIQESSVLMNVAKGFTNRQIADLLDLQHATIRTYLHSLYCKTGLITREKLKKWGKNYFAFTRKARLPTNSNPSS